MFGGVDCGGEPINNISRLLGLCLLIVTALVPVHAETLSASSAGSASQPFVQPAGAADYSEGERLFSQAKTKQACLAALAKFDPSIDTTGWCKEFDGNLVFQITNQSPVVDPVDFLISLDGKRIIEKEMAYGAAHHLETIAVQVPLGKHVILVESKNGQAKKQHTITVKDRLYVGISYWHYTEEALYGPVKQHFQIKTSSYSFSIK